MTAALAIDPLDDIQHGFAFRANEVQGFFERRRDVRRLQRNVSNDLQRRSLRVNLSFRSYLFHVGSNDFRGEGLLGNRLQGDRRETLERISQQRHVRFTIGVDERRCQTFLEHATKVIDELEDEGLLR